MEIDTVTDRICISSRKCFQIEEKQILSAEKRKVGYNDKMSIDYDEHRNDHGICSSLFFKKYPVCYSR